MNIYKYAMKMEKDGENYYRELANKTGDVGLRNILKMLANDEVKHYHIIEQMMKSDVQPVVKMTKIKMTEISEIDKKTDFFIIITP